MPMRTLVLLATLPLAFALPVQAQDTSASAELISAGAYSKAETRLQSQLRANPESPEVMINLAALYAKTGRISEARVLYRQILAQDDVLMDLSETRTAGSHAIAQTGLRRIDAVQFSAR
jgi:thioredoxin-like negative regulator of GroEL